MFDVIIDKIKECSSSEIADRPHDITKESTVVKIQPQSYDEGVCISKLDVVCISKAYETALFSFDRICQGLDELCDEDGEVLDISLSSTVIKYDTVSGMVRIIGTFDCYTEVMGDGFN